MNASDKIVIGNNVHISSFCIINTGFLINEREVLGDHRTLPVKIGDNVWLGSGVIVNPGVHIGEGSVIGSGAVVVDDIPAHSLAVGVPAKVKKTI